MLKAGDEDTGDEDDGDDLARRCPISFCLSSASLGPLTLSSILFYFFFSCSLSLCFSPNDLARWKETRLLQTFAQEVNNAR